ncbi:hypothetical protein [Pelobium manganitolerans]|nr:hypothetical protein [Pelobium manganitolerans]
MKLKSLLILFLAFTYLNANAQSFTTNWEKGELRIRLRRAE